LVELGEWDTYCVGYFAASVGHYRRAYSSMLRRAHRLSSATSTGSSAILSVSLLPGSVSDTLADPLESATSSER